MYIVRKHVITGVYWYMELHSKKKHVKQPIRSAIKESDIEQNVVIDFLESFGYFWLALRRRWPSRRAVAEARIKEANELSIF